jgi:hypothetical protein
MSLCPINGYFPLSCSFDVHGTCAFILLLDDIVNEVSAEFKVFVVFNVSLYT